MKKGNLGKREMHRAARDLADAHARALGRRYALRDVKQGPYLLVCTGSYDVIVDRYLNAVGDGMLRVELWADFSDLWACVNEVPCDPGAVREAVAALEADVATGALDGRKTMDVTYADLLAWA